MGDGKREVSGDAKAAANRVKDDLCSADKDPFAAHRLGIDLKNTAMIKQEAGAIADQLNAAGVKTEANLWRHGAPNPINPGVDSWKGNTMLEMKMGGKCSDGSNFEARASGEYGDHGPFGFANKFSISINGKEVDWLNHPAKAFAEKSSKALEEAGKDLSKSSIKGASDAINGILTGSREALSNGAKELLSKPNEAPKMVAELNKIIGFQAFSLQDGNLKVNSKERGRDSLVYNSQGVVIDGQVARQRAYDKWFGLPYGINNGDAKVLQDILIKMVKLQTMKNISLHPELVEKK